MSDKLYIVKSGDKTRIVSAPNKVAALRHAAQSEFEVTLSTNAELIALTKAGVEVEHAVVAAVAVAAPAEA